MGSEDVYKRQVLLPCTVDGDTAESALGRLPVHSTSVAGSATLMLRPEQLTAVTVSDRQTAAANRAATVLASEFRGHDVMLTVALGDGHAPITVRQHSINPPAVGAMVRLEVDGTAVAFADSSAP